MSWLALWVATYLVHSTILLALAWLLARRARRHGHAGAEWMWRAALLAGITSATAQSLIGVRPLVGRLPRPALDAQAWLRELAERPPATLERTLPIPAVEGIDLALERPAAAAVSGPERGPARSGALVAGRGALAPAALPRATPSRDDSVLALAGLGAGLWCLLVAARASLALGRRRELRDGPWPRELERLAAEAGLWRRVRLTVSPRIAAPLALGVWRPEICVPERALAELSPALARAALAHELAHHARWDPLWLGIAHALRSLLFVQPLHRLALRELVRLAELGADDWAARRTGDRLGLARCLTEVAGWLAAREAPPGACAMVRRASAGGLEERVRALLAERPPRGPAARPRARRAALAAVLAASPLALPGLGEGTESGPAPRHPRPLRAHPTAALARRLAGDLDAIEGRLELLAAQGGERSELLALRGREARAELQRLEAALARLLPHPPDVP